MSGPITLIFGIGLVAAVAWALIFLSEVQKKIAEGVTHIIGNTTERERKESIKPAQSIWEEQAQAQASSKSLIEQSMRQTQQQIELQQRTVFLLEQVLSELKKQSLLKSLILPRPQSLTARSSAPRRGWWCR